MPLTCWPRLMEWITQPPNSFLVLVYDEFRRLAAHTGPESPGRPLSPGARARSCCACRRHAHHSKSHAFFFRPRVGDSPHSIDRAKNRRNATVLLSIESISMRNFAPCSSADENFWPVISVKSWRSHIQSCRFSYCRFLPARRIRRFQGCGNIRFDVENYWDFPVPGC